MADRQIPGGKSIRKWQQKTEDLIFGSADDEADAEKVHEEARQVQHLAACKARQVQEMEAMGSFWEAATKASVSRFA